MQLEVHIQAIQQDLATTAGLGDEATAEAARRMSEALASTLHLRLLDLLGEAAAEIGSQLSTGRVEVRLVLSGRASVRAAVLRGRRTVKTRRTGVLVYPVVLARALPDIFRWIAGVTGARAFTAPPRDVDAAVRAVVGELRHQYLIGYSPRRPLTYAPGRWRLRSRRS